MIAKFVQAVLAMENVSEVSWMSVLGASSLPFSADAVLLYVKENGLLPRFVDPPWKGADGLHLVQVDETHFEVFLAEHGTRSDLERFDSLESAVHRKIHHLLDQVQGCLAIEARCQSPSGPKR